MRTAKPLFAPNADVLWNGLVRSGSLERHESEMVGHRIDAEAARRVLAVDTVIANGPLLVALVRSLRAEVTETASVQE